MREKSKKEEIVSGKDLQKEQAGIAVRNNPEKGKEMNLTAVKREPVEMTETEPEVKELNITQEEADLIRGVNELNIRGKIGGLESAEGVDEVSELKAHGPTGGVPVNHCQHPLENKHIPVGPPLMPQYAHPQTYQQLPNYAAQHGRRMLDEPEQPAAKFRAAPNFHPHQMPQYDVNNFSQSHIQPGFNPNMVYQPGQMFGLSQQQEKINLTMKNSQSGGTVTVTSPELQFMSDPFEGFGEKNQNLADNLLEEWDTQGLPQMQKCGLQQMLQQQISMNNINQPGPIGYPQSRPQMPVTSQMQVSAPAPIQTNMGYNNFSKPQDFTGQSFRDPQSRRISDPNDSGMESAGEASPYPSTPSPNGSTYTSPPSVDSGCGKSPGYEPFSPESNSQSSVGGSPPKYTATLMSPGYRDTKSPGSGYGSPGTPQVLAQMPQVPTPMSMKTASPGPDQGSSQGVGEKSKYIDEHLDGLQDALNVIANDIQSDADRKAAKKQGSQQKMPLNLGNANIPVAPVQNQVPLPLNPVPATTVVPSTSGVTTIILPPQHMVAHSSGMVAQPQPTAMNPGNSVVLVPTGVLILPTQGNQKPPQPKRKEPRPIRPKMPAGTQNGPNPSQSPVSSSMPSTVQPGMKVARPVPPPNIQAIKQQQQKNLNMARRNVAAVKTENLVQVDEEGDTYLHIAVIRTDRFMIQALIERLKRESLMYLIDQENNKRQTPLFLAVAVNEPGKVQLLIKDGGANVNTLAQNLSSDGQTTEVRAAIHVASVGGKEYLKTLDELLKAPDVSINIVNNYGQTALHCAILAHGKERKTKDGGIVSIDSRSIIQTLIKKGADPMAQDKKSGKTPLMYAIEHRNISLVETILGAVDHSKVRNVVKTQAFDGSSCLKIAEGIKRDFNDFEFNRLWDILQGAISGNVSRIQPQVF